MVSMLELNPEAIEIAAALDAERAAGKVRGPLHGIPISLKDNIATGDGMHNTAGAAALADSRSDVDSEVASRLRDAGAVIIGKANLSEWAFWMHAGQSGYSALGGQVVNPYGAEFDPLGSSTGSAVGTSANLVAASIGTETLGSIIAPASANGVVGMYPSRGLVSRDRVIPVTDQTDSPGPITRTVEDAAVLLTILAADDTNSTDFSAGLDAASLEGARVGVYTGLAEPLDGIDLAGTYELLGMTSAISGLEDAGAETVPLWSAAPDNSESFADLGNNGLRIGFAEYIAIVDPEGPIASIADVVAFNQQDLDRNAHFGQERLEDAASSELSQDDYEALGSQLREDARSYIDGVITENELDVIASRSNTFSSAYAVAGYPSVTVPLGATGADGAKGLTFSGPHLADSDVLNFAHAFEQATRLRVVPDPDRSGSVE